MTGDWLILRSLRSKTCLSPSRRLGNPHVKPFICLAIAIATTSPGRLNCVYASPPAGFALSLSWQLLDNRPDDRFESQLVLRNDGRAAVSDGWELYFNSPRQLVPDSVGPGCRLSHINGDLYVLRPTPSFKPLVPAEHRTISLDGSPCAINISDAPSGFYIVLDRGNGKTNVPMPIPLEVKPFPEASKLHRGAKDSVPLATPESRYRENESITRLPPEQLVKVVPTPVEIREMSGRVTLNSSTLVFYEPSLSNEANYAADAIGELFHRRLTAKEGIPATSDRSAAIRLRVGEIKLAGLLRKNGDEAYQLTIDPEKGVEIIGSDPAGVFYGVQTLRALLPIKSYRRAHDALVVDAVRIADSPRFRYRGLHLDVARNFQTKQTVQKLLDVMSFYKLNRLHLHLTDDEGWRIEIKQLPELTGVGGRRGHTLDESDCLIPSLGSGPFPDPEKSPGSGFYSQDVFIDLLRYAHARHVTIVPELDLPGHARAAVKSLEARQRRLNRGGNDQTATPLLLREPGDTSKYESVQMWRDNVVDVGRPDTYRFLELVVGELTAMYERAACSPYHHSSWRRRSA